MLAPGMQSTSLRLVAGADLTAASNRILLAASTLGTAGNLLLNNTQVSATGSNGVPIPSVLRTGTGSLDLLAGGSIKENSLYGIYTAGTDTGATGLAAGTYMPDHGGDLTLVAQGDVTGYSYNDRQNNIQFWSPANWLVRSGDATTKAAWSINFGGNVTTNGMTYLRGFAGFGTLGGGNVTLQAGGNAGALTQTSDGSSSAQVYSALQVSVGATGQVLSVSKAGASVTGGALAEAGGGNLVVKIGGALNSVGGGFGANGSLSLFANLRGDTSISAGSIGLITPIYGFNMPGDPRGLNPTNTGLASTSGGIVLTPGDGSAIVRTAADLVVGTYADAGQTFSDISTSAFALWRPDTTAVSLFSAGGNLAPVTGDGLGNSNWQVKGGGYNLVVAPGRLSAVAAQGSLYLGGGQTLELAPSPSGDLQLLAGQSIYDGAQSVASTRIVISGAKAGVNDIPNPFRPATLDSNGGYYNYASFQDDTVTTNLHAVDHDPIRIYAAKGDIVNLAFGEVNPAYYNNALHTLYLAAKPARIIAGGDIVNLGAGSDGTTPGLILNNNPTDVSIIRAGGNIYYTNMQVAGPGELDVTAGGTIYQGGNGSIVSIGALAAGDTRPGASILMQAGAGLAGPNYAGLLPYLDPANLAVVGTPLIEQRGKVAKTYEKELQAWLKERFGFAGADDEERRAYFASLASEQQSIFLRQVYFAELKAGGREYNDPGSSRHGSYLRGRTVIDTLFPEKDKDDKPISYAGNITMFGGAGVRTLFGGDIQMLTSGGRTVIGVEGLVPPASSGIVTQGQGDISMYSKGSILLGLSRIMTTMGGDILAWSAEGDINAGRGSKTTIVYTPPKRIYDNYGNVTLSPNVPSSGSGIASRSSIPGILGGDIDLIAPLGTIDAGEAGIRAGANVNLVALQIVNAANIQAQGNVSGVPQIQAPNIGGLTEATNTAGAAQAVTKTEQHAATAQASVIIVEVIGFGGGDEDDDGEQRREEPRGQRGTQVEPLQDPESEYQVLGAGEMTAAEARDLIAARRSGGDQ